MKKFNKLDPWFISGFVDAEGSFMVHIRKCEYGLGWRVEIHFTIGSHISDVLLLKKIKKIFGDVGHIYKNKNMAFYTIKSSQDIYKYILPHFAFAF